GNVDDGLIGRLITMQQAPHHGMNDQDAQPRYSDEKNAKNQSQLSSRQFVEPICDPTGHRSPLSVAWLSGCACIYCSEDRTVIMRHGREAATKAPPRGRP